METAPRRAQALRTRSYARCCMSRKEHTVPTDLITNTVVLASAYLRGRDRITASHGLTSNEFTLIRCFADQEEWTATELTEVLPADASRISRLVDGLVSRGLLRRRRRTDDRRVVRLLLTDEGSTAVQEVVDLVEEYEAHLLQGVADDERAVMAAAVETMLANLDTLEPDQSA